MLGDMHDRLGLERGVIVQGTAHGTDNAALLDALAAAPRRYRGVVVVDEDTGTGDLRRMAGLGVCGARFNHLLRDGKPALAGGVGIDRFFALHDRMADLGWHLQLWIDCRDLPDLWPRLEDAAVPIVVDHMGRPDGELGLAHPGFDFLVGLLARGKVWVKLSGCYRATDGWPDYNEARPFHDALVAANPGQCLWGLDWPHPNLAATMPDDGHLLDLFDRWTTDGETRRRILVDNPARLYGFDGSGG